MDQSFREPATRPAPTGADDLKTMGEEAYAMLRADLIAGRLDPGQKLRFRQLSAHYNVGIAPLREALARLASERLVDFHGQRGFAVASVSPEELEELCSLRIDLTCKALRASISRGDEDWEAEILVSLHRLERSPRPTSDDAEGFDEWERRHDRFHESLVAACNSRWLLHFCGTLSDQFQRYRRLIVLRMSESDQDWSRIRDQHRTIAEATLARNTELAVDLVTRHFEGSVRQVTELYQRSAALDALAVNASRADRGRARGE